MTYWPILNFMLIQKYKYSEYLIEILVESQEIVEVGKNQLVILGDLISPYIKFKRQANDRKTIIF